MNKQSIYKKPESRDELCRFMDNVLSMWPYPHETQMIDTRFGGTHVLTAGDMNKPALVLLHGAASNLLAWGGDLPQLMQDFFVIVPDIPGEAGKSDPVLLSWENGDTALWLSDLLGVLQIKKVSIAGMSLGGFIALKFAGEYSHHIERLVLVAPAGLVEEDETATGRLIEYSNQKEKGTGEIKSAILGDADVHPFVKAFLELIGKHFNPRMEKAPVISDEDLKRITSPMLLILGEKDIIFDSVKIEQRLKFLKLPASVYIVQNGGHALIGQTEKIAAFLKEGIK